MPYHYSSRAAETRDLSGTDVAVARRCRKVGGAGGRVVCTNVQALADWPPIRGSGPEPGSYDSMPATGPLGGLGCVGSTVPGVKGMSGLPVLSNMERTGLQVAVIAGAAWYFWLRKKPKRGRAR